MSFWWALLIICSAILALILLGGFSLLINTRKKENALKQYENDFSLYSGKIYQTEEIYNNENIKNFISFLSEKYSNDLLQNRISDLCGLIFTVFSWFQVIIFSLIWIMMFWFVFTKDIEYAYLAWLSVFLTISCFILEYVLSGFCKLLTGRYPGQAKETRKALIDMLKTMPEENAQ